MSKFLSLRDQYFKTIADKMSISLEDLTDTEKEAIGYCFNIFNDRLEDIKELTEQNKRLSIELANEKAYHDQRDNFINGPLD